MALFLYVNFAITIGGEIYAYILDREIKAELEAPISANSDYGHLIQKYAKFHSLDWRFVAAMISTESSFRTDVVSSAGAVGLMQVLPWIAHAEGVKNIQDPEANISFGLKHFKRYFSTFRGETKEDTLKINLAVYNAGYGHIQDARKLAVHMGLNPRKWSSIEAALPLLEDKEFHPFVKYGYCQGNSVIAYVNKIFKTYNKYQKKNSSSNISELKSHSI